MLLIDGVENIIADSEATGIKAVSGNEGHISQGISQNFR